MSEEGLFGLHVACLVVVPLMYIGFYVRFFRHCGGLSIIATDTNDFTNNQPGYAVRHNAEISIISGATPDIELSAFAKENPTGAAGSIKRINRGNKCRGFFI